MSLPKHPRQAGLLEPEGGFEPSTYRLQIGCAAVAPLGHASLNRKGVSGVTKIDPRNGATSEYRYPPQPPSIQLDPPRLTAVSEAVYTRFKSLYQEVWLAEVIIGDNESFESALKRFTKRVQQDGILAEARRREHYEKPSVRRKKKAAAKRRKSRKTAA